MRTQTRSRRTANRALVALGASTALTSCFLDLDYPNRQANGRGGAGGSAGESGAGGGSPYDWSGINECPEATECGQDGNGCISAGVPEPLDRAASDSTNILEPFYFGFTRMRIGNVADDVASTPDQDAWRTIGFDLDGVCTNSATCGIFGQASLVDARSCKSSYGARTPFDGTDCRDNAVGQFFALGAPTSELEKFGFSERHWNCGIRAGWFNLITKVSNYNGERNDDAVRVDIYSSTGTETPGFSCTAGEGGMPPDDWYERPTWQSSTRWHIARRSISPIVNEELFGDHIPDGVVSSSDAFVRDGWLVAHLPENSELWLNGHSSDLSGFRLLLRRGVLAAKLVRDPETQLWTVEDGTIGGVVLAVDVLSAFREIGFCENLCATYASLGNSLMDFTDSVATTGTNFPSAPCDGMSLGISFQGQQVTGRRMDIVDVPEPVDCPNPKNPELPRHGCVCPGAGGDCE